MMSKVYRKNDLPSFVFCKKIPPAHSSTAKSQHCQISFSYTNIKKKKIQINNIYIITEKKRKKNTKRKKIEKRTYGSFVKKQQDAKNFDKTLARQYFGLSK